MPNASSSETLVISSCYKEKENGNNEKPKVVISQGDMNAAILFRSTTKILSCVLQNAKQAVSCLTLLAVLPLSIYVKGLLNKEIYKTFLRGCLKGGIDARQEDNECIKNSL